jgi:predicted nucleic acid-binding Zn ribbon protein
MKSGIRKESRAHILRDLWLKHGCPERMMIHVRKTGETIQLVNGLPVTDNAENSPLSMHTSKAQKRRLRVGQPVTGNRRCKICQSKFSSIRKDAKYCSPRCRQKAVRLNTAERRRQEADRMLSVIYTEPAPIHEQV